MSRASDDRVLNMVKMRSAGRTTVEIARKYGVTAGLISKVTNKVMRDDIAHCGEKVAARYWERRT